jgi:hypothetical protein|tara:strand:- start:376 stop:495 length:120 start_codon:yes stop_codon:yes gene_type:complete
MEKFLDFVAFVVLVVLPISIVIGVWIAVAKSAVTLMGAM